MHNPPQRRTEFLSFDGSVRLITSQQRPDRFRHLESILDRKLIARGGGYAYSAASFGANSCSIEMSAFNRLLAFEQATSTLEVEAGATLIDVFQWAIQHGLQIPVVPGYPLITIGGCIAADVHGKNPWRDGTFGDWVRAITIFHPDKGYVNVSPGMDSTLFDLTRGGFGLTGIIVSATVELTPLLSTEVDLRHEPVSNLSEAIGRLAECSDDFCYSWHDVARTSSFGRGLVTSGRWVQSKLHHEALSYRPMNSKKRASLPISIWNSFTSRCANEIFFQMQSRWSSRRRTGVLEAAFPLARNAAYLAGFGRAGLREVQILLDGDNIVSFISGFERIAVRERPPLIMASLKRFRGRQGALSQTGTGYLMAIDLLPGKAGARFLTQLDELMIDMNGQPNLSKDSRLSCDVAKRSIRNYATFCEKLHRYDPSRRFCSELSERIGL